MQLTHGFSHFNLILNLLWVAKITSHGKISTSPTEGFYSASSLALTPCISSLLGPLVHAERRKSSNKMPNHGYLIAGTLTFSSSYLMVVFICQTNVRNTIPQAQSLWQHRQLLLLSLRLPPPSLPPSLHSSHCELQATRLQYHSYHSNRDTGDNSSPKS